MESNTTKQFYTFVNVCGKSWMFALATILGKAKGRGF